MELEPSYTAFPFRFHVRKRSYPFLTCSAVQSITSQEHTLLNEEQDELEWEEWNLGSLRRIKAGCDTLKLCNEAGKEIDEPSLADSLARIQGLERIKTLHVQPSSRLESLLFLKALPGLEALHLYGLRLRSLDGLEWFQSGRFIWLDTGKNRKRDIGKLAEVPINKLTLQWANPGDMEAIGRSSTLQQLELMGCPGLSLHQWRGVPLESLRLFHGTFAELGDTRHLASLRNMTLFQCRKLERFVGDNGNVTWMVVQQCNQLDWRTIATVRNLEHLTILSGNKQEVPLSAFLGLRQLQNLSLLQGKLQPDVPDLKRSLSKLEELSIGGLKKPQAVELSLANPGVRVTNGVWSYTDGSPVGR
jgi:hypothetical protein